MDGSPAPVSLRAFAWSPLHRHAVQKWASDPRGPVSRIVPPDYLFDPDGPHALPQPEGYDQFGWYKGRGDCLRTHIPFLYRLDDVSVLRRSLGRDRWHILLSEGICAQDSYHDGAWLGPHIGETVRLGLQGGDLSLVANIMDDPPIEARVKAPCVLISHFWCENYAHTLLETASRFQAIEQAKALCPEASDCTVIWDTNKPWQKEVAEWLAPGRARPLPHNHVLFDRLYVPGFGISQSSVQWLRKRFGAPEKPGKRRIFVSRADATERRIKNENETLELLEKKGFESVLLTGMSVKEQRDLFREAEAVVFPHGAGCANMLFCAPGTKILEIVPRSYQHPMFWHIAKWSGHWYGRIVALDSENKDMHADLTVISCGLEAAGI